MRFPASGPPPPSGRQCQVDGEQCLAKNYRVTEPANTCRRWPRRIASLHQRAASPPEACRDGLSGELSRDVALGVPNPGRLEWMALGVRAAGWLWPVPASRQWPAVQSHPAPTVAVVQAVLTRGPDHDLPIPESWDRPPRVEPPRGGSWTWPLAQPASLAHQSVESVR